MTKTFKRDARGRITRDEVETRICTVGWSGEKPMLADIDVQVADYIEHEALALDRRIHALEDQMFWMTLYMKSLLEKQKRHA